jgi:AcrR family transcriptional regulator
LLDTARALFCERGFAGATIDEIAARLGASKHTIYNRYASKLVLLEAVVDRDVARFRQALEDAGMAALDPLDSLQSMARAYFGFSVSPGYSALYAAVALEAATSAHLRRRLGEWASVSLEPVRAAIEAATPAEGWHVPVDEVCAILVDLLDGEANRVKWSGAGDLPSAIEMAFERRWQSFRRAAGAGMTAATD